MIRKIVGKKRIVLLVFTGIILFIISSISYLYFGAEQIQHRMKERICDEVITHKDELLGIIEECPSETSILSFEKDDEDSQSGLYKEIYYKDLQIKEINKVFKDFRLIWILKEANESVVFAIKPTVASALWDNYGCGFYYTKNDKPMDIWAGRETQETEFYEIEFTFRRWYRTEKITDNWWFYETKDYFYPTPR